MCILLQDIFGRNCCGIDSLNVAYYPTLPNMESSNDIRKLRKAIDEQERHLRKLKRDLALAEVATTTEDPYIYASENGKASELNVPFEQSTTSWPWPLKAEEYKRYGRQMILPEIGLQGGNVAFLLRFSQQQKTNANDFSVPQVSFAYEMLPSSSLALEVSAVLQLNISPLPE